MKKRRVFIAINFPAQIKKKLLEFQREWADLPVRWTKEANLHITLVFVGYVNDEEMLEICQLTRQITKRHQPFEIKLKRICLGPPDRENPALTQLKNNLEEGLFDSSKSGYNHRENRPFQIHITLARIRQEEWRELPSKPKIDEEISLVFPVASAEVMESYLSSRGPDYTVLESVELGE
jgi:2'-5' RNA ligase